MYYSSQVRGLRTSKTLQGWLMTSILATVLHIRNTFRNKKQKCLPEKELLKGQQLKKETPFDESLSKTSTIPMDESFKQPE